MTFFVNRPLPPVPFWISPGEAAERRSASLLDISANGSAETHSEASPGPSEIRLPCSAAKEHHYPEGPKLEIKINFIQKQTITHAKPS